MSTHYNPATVEFIKQQQERRAKRRLLASVAGVFVLAGIAAGGYLGYQAYKKNQLAAAQAQALNDIRSATNDRDRMERARAAIDAGQLSWEQLRAEREKEWQATMEGYFKTPAKDRDKYLDKIIDEMQARMRQWDRDRPTTRPTTRPNWEGRGPTTRPNDGNRQAEREARQRQQADNQSPQQRAQNAEFRAALAARMQARGMQGGPRGGPGGGGGRGPGGGGGRGPGGGGGR